MPAVPPLSTLAHVSGVVDIQLSAQRASCPQPDMESILPPSCVWVEGYPVSRVFFLGFPALCTHQDWVSCQSSLNARRRPATLLIDVDHFFFMFRHGNARYPEPDLRCALRLVLLLAC